MFETSTTRASIGSPSSVMPIGCRCVASDRRAPQPRERVAPAPVVLAPVHELRVDAERDVVQEEAVVRAADVDPALLAVRRTRRARRPGRRGRARGRARSGCASRTGCRRTAGRARSRPRATGAERAVAARHPERVRVGARGRAPPGRRPRRARASRSRARAAAATSSSAPPSPERGFTIRKRGHRRPIPGLRRFAKDGPNGSCGRPAPGSIICPWKTAASSTGSRTTSPRRGSRTGRRAACRRSRRYLAKHLAFLSLPRRSPSA